MSKDENKTLTFKATLDLVQNMEKLRGFLSREYGFPVTRNQMLAIMVQEMLRQRESSRNAA